MVLRHQYYVIDRAGLMKSHKINYPTSSINNVMEFQEIQATETQVMHACKNSESDDKARTLVTVLVTM